MKEYLCAILATVGYLFIYLLGGWDVALQCLLLAIVFDYISGMIKAYHTKTISSKIGFYGILKKNIPLQKRKKSRKPLRQA